MRPHGFVQFIEKNRLYEEGLRSEAEEVSRGEILEAAYLERTRPRGLFRRLFGRGGETLGLRLPFDEEGADVLGLWSPEPLVRETDAPGESVRRAAGRALPLGGVGDGPILRDLWVPERSLRVCEGHDFLLEAEHGPPVVVSYGLAPLVIARPRRCAVVEELGKLHARTVKLAGRHGGGGGEGRVVELVEGDRLEVLGVPKPRTLSARRGALERAGDPYRGYQPPDLVMGDEEGTRLVLRIVEGAGAE